IWESEDGSTKFYTYNMLLGEVSRFANALRSFGVKKGDGVAIYLPNLAEAFIAVLACFRIGAVYNSIFSGFSQNALRDRLINFKPKVIVTTDGTPRRGNIIKLKEKVDNVIDDIPSIEKVIVVRSEEHTSELQSRENLVCRLLLEKKNAARARDDRGETRT